MNVVYIFYPLQKKKKFGSMFIKFFNNVSRNWLFFFEKCFYKHVKVKIRISCERKSIMLKEVICNFLESFVAGLCELAPVYICVESEYQNKY